MRNLLMCVRCVLSCVGDQEKREVPNLESFLSVGKLGLAPASPSLRTGFLKEILKFKSKENAHTIIGNETYITYIWAHLLLSHPISAGQHSTVEQKHWGGKRTGATQKRQTSTIQPQTPVYEH